MHTKPDFIVACPSYSGKIEHGHACVTVRGMCDIRIARHLVLADCLERAPGKPILWLDDDVRITDRDIHELFEVQEITGADVVAGWYPCRIPEYATAYSRPTEPMMNTPKGGGYHGRWSELTACVGGCTLTMPSVWQLFPRDEWLLVDAQTFQESPPAYLNCPTWDRVSTTDDYDFSVNIRRRGARIVSANRVFAIHHGRRMPPKVIQAILRSDALPTVEWVRILSRATQSTADLVILSDREPSPEYVAAAKDWCVDMGHPAKSPRFLFASDGEHEIMTPATARLRFFGVPTPRIGIHYPSAKRLTPSGSPSTGISAQLADEPLPNLPTATDERAVA